MDKQLSEIISDSIALIDLATFNFVSSSQYIYKNSKLAASLMKWYIRFLPGWSEAEIKCIVHVALPKRCIN